MARRKSRKGRKSRKTARRGRPAKRKSRKTRRRNARGLFETKGRRGKRARAHRGRRGQYRGGRGRKGAGSALWARPRKPNPGRRRRRNPNGGGRMIFGLKLPKMLAPLAPVLREDHVQRAVGAAAAFGFYPLIEAKIVDAAGLREQAWWPTDTNVEGEAKTWQYLAINYGAPVAVGGAALMLTRKGGPLVRHVGEGFGMGCVGLALGRVMADYLYPSLPPDIQPQVMKVPTASGLTDYLPYRGGAAGFLAEHGGASGFLTEHGGAADYLPYRAGAGALAPEEPIYN